MPIVTTQAILLRAHAYSEASRVLRFYSRELGLVGVMAKGVRRGASKGKGSTGTLAEGTAVINFRPGRGLQSLREFAPAKVRFGLATDLGRLGGASVAAELILRHTAEEPNPELYDLLSVGLDRVEEIGEAQLLGELLTLLWQMVRLLGFGPELHHCIECGRELANDEMGRFDLQAGGVRCCDCAQGKLRRIGPQARSQIAHLLAGRVPPDLQKMGRAHLSLLDDFVTVHLLGGRRLTSFRFLQELAPAERVAADASSAPAPTRPASAPPKR